MWTDIPQGNCLWPRWRAFPSTGPLSGWLEPDKLPVNSFGAVMWVCNNFRLYTKATCLYFSPSPGSFIAFTGSSFPHPEWDGVRNSLTFPTNKAIWMPKPLTRVQRSLKRRCRSHVFHLARGYFGLQTEPLNRKAEEWCFSSGISSEFLIMSLLLLRCTFIVPCKIATARFTIPLYILILWYYLLDIILIRH